MATVIKKVTWHARLQQEDRRCGVFILLNKLVTDIPNVQYDVHRPEN